MKTNKTIIKLTEYFKTDKGRRIIIVTLISAAVIIALSGLIPKKKSGTSANVSNISQTAEEFEQYTQQRLCDILKKIDGVGRCYVMVTVSDGGESFYNKEGSRESETQRRSDATLQESERTEENYVIIENSDGDQSVLSSYRLQPKICGVVVVCDGGETPRVRERVINAVKAALNIGSERIYVTKT